MKYYCIGIKGAGMSTLANILSDLGNDVSVSHLTSIKPRYNTGLYLMLLTLKTCLY